MKAHELASFLPELDSDDLKSLAEDIKTHGQREEIVMLDGQILDGRNRFAACKIAGVEPKFRDLKKSEGDPIAFVISENLKRRHLSDKQRATIAGELAAQSERGRPKAEANGDGGKSAPMTQAAAAELMQVSPASVRRATKVAKSGSKKLKAAVKEGKVSVSKAAAVAKQPKENQMKAAKAAPEKKVSPKDKLVDGLNQLWLDRREDWSSHRNPAKMFAEIVKWIEKAL